MSKVRQFNQIIQRFTAYGDVVISGLRGRGWKDEDELPLDMIMNCYLIDIPAYRCAMIIQKLKTQKEKADESG